MRKKVEKTGKNMRNRWENNWKEKGEVWKTRGENHGETGKISWKHTHAHTHTEELGVGGGEHLNIRSFISDPENHHLF